MDRTIQKIFQEMLESKEFKNLTKRINEKSKFPDKVYIDKKGIIWSSGGFMKPYSLN